MVILKHQERRHFWRRSCIEGKCEKGAESVADLVKGVDPEIVGRPCGGLGDLFLSLVLAAQTQQGIAPENVAVDGIDLFNIVLKGHGGGGADAVVAAQILVFQQIGAGFQHFLQDGLGFTEAHQLPQCQSPEHGQLGYGSLVDGGFLKGLDGFFGLTDLVLDFLFHLLAAENEAQRNTAGQCDKNSQDPK